MADILTRLLLDTKGFDANLTKSKQSVNDYQSSVTNMAQTAGAGVLKFAGAIGMAAGAGEGFMKTIRSAQATNDAFDNNMNACKDSVDAFFVSLATGDFTAFENGLFSVFTKAKELSAALDDIADKRLSVDLVDLKKQGEMTALEAIIRDSGKSKKEHAEALAKYQQLGKEVANSRLDISKEELKGHTNVELNKIGVKNLSQDDVTLYLEKLNNKDLNQEFLKELKYVSDYTKSYDEAWSKVAKYYQRNGADAKYYKMESDFNAQWESPDKWMKRAFPKSEFKNSAQLKDFGRLFNQGDNGRTILYEYTKKLYEAEGQNAADIRKLTRLKNSAGKEGGSSGGAKAEEKPLEGSLAWFDAEITKKNKELINATTMQARIAAQATINELETQKIQLKFVVEQGAFKSKYGEMKNTDLKMNGMPSHTKETPVKEITKIPKIKTPIKKKDIALNEEYGESLSAIGDIMGNVSGAFDGNAASILQWGASLFSTIGQAIPAIMTLMGVKVTDTAVTNANTTAEVTNAGAKVMSAHAGIPFVGVALGIAGMAAIIAAMASMPKFANGGIVPGGSFSGDKVPALLNSGEMILNGSQQANLFKQLNGGVMQRMQVGTPLNSLRESISPDESSRNIDVSGDWKIRTSDLYLVLKNYMNKTGKKL